MSGFFSSLISARSLIALVLCIALSPIAAAYADSFTVTSNKDLYVAGEKAIIVGIIPEDAAEGYAVLLRVTGPDGSECVVQNVLPDSDSSFVSRPLNLGDCGSGEYTVMAFYSDISANATFTVSNTTQNAFGNNLELRLLKNVAVRAQETVNARLAEFLESNPVLPEDIADSYSLGVFEASLVFQALDFGDTADAKKHLIFTVKHFRQVMDSLLTERIFIDQTVEVDTANDDVGEEMLVKYGRLKEFYFRLKELAEKNGIENEREFGIIVSVLAKSKQLIDDGNVEEAKVNLDEAYQRLESVRQLLYGISEYGGNVTGSEDAQAKRLGSVANKFERDAYNLLQGDISESVNATVQRALQLISLARLDIENGDYKSAKNNLSEAFSAIDEAKDMKKEESDKTGDKKDSSHDNENSEDSSGSEKDDDKENNEGDENGLSPSSGSSNA